MKVVHRLIHRLATRTIIAPRQTPWWQKMLNRRGVREGASRVLHCWADPREDRTGLEWWEEHPAAAATCLLLDGHDGPHEYTPDNEIVLTFEGGRVRRWLRWMRRHKEGDGT